MEHMKTRTLLLLACTSLLGGLVPGLQAQTPPGTATPPRPENPAAATLAEAIRQNALGNVEGTVAPALVTIEVNGQKADSAGAVFLVEPGEEMILRATCSAPPAGGVQPRTFKGWYRQTSLQEVVWQGEPDDTIITAADDSIKWNPGTATGKVSYVTASVASLDLKRADAETPTKAPILSGRAGVLFVTGVPFDRTGDGMVQGANIGIYPNEKSDRAPEIVKSNEKLYAPPTTLYRLDERTSAAKILPYMTLGELAPATFPESTSPRYIALSPRLIKFMARFGTKLQEAGLNPERLVVLRGFVSPNERQRLEQRDIRLAEFTRFQYGDAVALVYTDGKAPRSDAKMTDVTSDGIVDEQDIAKLAAIAKDTMDELQNYGGVGMIAKFEGPGAAAGTPYLHVDLRGWYVGFKEGF